MRTHEFSARIELVETAHFRFVVSAIKSLQLKVSLPKLTLTFTGIGT